MVVYVWVHLCALGGGGVRECVFLSAGTCVAGDRGESGGSLMWQQLD